MLVAIKKVMLRRLVRANMWGGKHTPFRFVLRGVPQRYKSTPEGKRTIKKVIKELAVDEWLIILPKRTGKSSEDHVSLNPRKSEEIMKFIQS